MRLDVTKKELTERLGIHRPSLSRKLGRMRADELVTYDRKGIGIRNLEAIRGALPGVTFLYASRGLCPIVLPCAALASLCSEGALQSAHATHFQNCQLGKRGTKGIACALWAAPPEYRPKKVLGN